jgi:hypothetical protein
MRADHLVHESGLVRPRASDIETASLNSGGHDTKADSDLRKQSEIYPVNIEAVAQLARFYAAGTPPDEEFRSIKERINAASNELPDKQKGAHLAPKEWRTAQEIWSRGVTHDPHAADGAFNQRTEITRKKSDFSAGLRALESSIRVVPCPSGLKDRFVSARALVRGRIFHVALVSFAAVIFWHSHVAKEMVGSWPLSVDRLLSVSTRKSPPALAASSELLRREAVLPEVTAARHSAKQFDVQQERIYADGAPTHGVKQNTRSKTSSPPVHSQVKRIPVPETKLTTIEGWMLREVTNGTAVLEGPNGIWTAKRGDTVPGVGRVESIVLWGERWIVATSSGLISTP